MIIAATLCFIHLGSSASAPVFLDGAGTHWNPPKTSIPKEFLRETKFLFEHGLGDPRGGEYREVTLAGGGPVIEALAAEGEAAVGPILLDMKSDERLTLGYSENHFGAYHGLCLTTVRGAEAAALKEIEPKAPYFTEYDMSGFVEYWKSRTRSRD